MRKHIYTGVMGNIYFSLISGLFFVYFGTTIGISRFGWGVMAGLSSFLLGGEMLSALIVQRVGKRKMIWFGSALASRALRVVGLLLSLWLWRMGSSHAGLVLIVAICAANFSGALASPPWMSWLADIIPEEQQGRFWGRRSAWIALSEICVLVPASLLMDRTPERYKLYLAVGIFVAAGVVGVLDILIHGTIPEPEMERLERIPFIAQVLQPLIDRPYRPWLVFNGFWTFSMTLGGSLATLYFLDELGIRKNFVGGTIATTCISLVGGLLTARWSGRLVDKWGPKRVLFWGHIFWATLPAFWIFATPATAVFWLFASSLIGGASSTAATNAATKLITRFPRPAHVAMYTAVSSCLGQLAGGLGVLTAGTFLRVMGDWQWSAFGWKFGAFQSLFIASVLFRMCSTLFLIPRIQNPPNASRRIG